MRLTILIAFVAACCFAAPPLGAISLKDLQQCSRNAEIVDTASSEKAHRQAPHIRTVKDLPVGADAYVVGLVSFEGRVFVLRSAVAFAKPGEQPDPEDLDFTVHPQTHIRRTTSGIEVDCFAPPFVVKLPGEPGYSLPVVGNFHGKNRAAR